MRTDIRTARKLLSLGSYFIALVEIIKAEVTKHVNVVLA